MYHFSSSSDEERKGGEDGGGVPVVWEPGCRNMSVVVMSFSQYISHCDRAAPSRALAWWHTLIGADDLVLSRSFFRV